MRTDANAILCLQARTECGWRRRRHQAGIGGRRLTIKEFGIFEIMFVADVCHQPECEQGVALLHRFGAVEPCVLHHPVHRLAAHQTLWIRRQIEHPISHVETAGTRIAFHMRCATLSGRGSAPATVGT